MATTRSATVFKANLRGTWAQVTKKATVILNGVVFDLYAEIVEETRVKTGRARRGWVISVHVAGSDAPPPGDYDELTGTVQAQQYVATLETAPLHAKRVIYNNVNYIVWLEIGTARFAGDHMVRLAIQRLKGS